MPRQHAECQQNFKKNYFFLAYHFGKEVAVLWLVEKVYVANDVGVLAFRQQLHFVFQGVVVVALQLRLGDLLHRTLFPRFLKA